MPGKVLKDSADADLATITAVTGWSKGGGGDDTAIDFKLAINFASAKPIKDSSAVVSAIFADTDTATTVEVNEFKIGNFADSFKSIGIFY